MDRIITIPNIISTARLLSIPIMIYCLITGNKELFQWLLLGALLSDILDGFIARTFKMVTRLGSMLDAMADTLMYFVVIPAIIIFQMDFLKQQWIPLAAFFAVFIAEKIKTFIKFKKFFNSFHNYLAKAMGYVHGSFILSLFFFGYQWFLFYPAIAIGIISAVEDMIVSSIVTTYENDTKGLYWVLKRKKVKVK
jgi:cardiolipin synthase (CMP-forming)